MGGGVDAQNEIGGSVDHIRFGLLASLPGVSLDVSDSWQSPSPPVSLSSSPTHASDEARCVSSLF